MLRCGFAVNLDNPESGLTPEPSVLTPGILPGAKLDGGDSLGEAAFSGEMGADLPDSDGLFRSRGKRAERGDFGAKAGLRHALNAPVNAIVEQAAIPKQSDSSVMRLVLQPCSAELGLGLAAKEADFQCPRDVAMVLQIDVGLSFTISV